MANAIDPLIDLNAKIDQASADNNFPRILLLDTKRRTLLKELASNPNFRSDEKTLTLLKKTAEQNQELMTQITTKMTELTQVTGNKIKMLRSYRMIR